MTTPIDYDALLKRGARVNVNDYPHQTEIILAQMAAAIRALRAERDGWINTAIQNGEQADALRAALAESERDAVWQPMESAPKDQRIMLSYPTGIVRFGEYASDRYAKTPRPYWSHDSEYLHGKLSVRANQPNGWKPVPAAMAAQEKAK